ncbi:MAG: hypothetical protein H2184_04605 [Candidatus Galacturonibacter soehngenii]|nr:hypothetical protein [Candidatus Galacturonibacter soehngenii]
MFNNMKSGKSRNQVFVILTYISLFFLSAVFSGITIKEDDKRVYILLLISGIWICYVINHFIPHCKQDWEKKLKETFLYLKENIEIFMVLTIAVLMRIGMLDNMQRWDGGEYYWALGKACENFDFTFSSFMNFVLAEHPTLGFATLMAIGEFQNPRGIVGVMVINLSITLIAIYCIYRMFRGYWCNMSKIGASLSAFVCSVLPLFLGTFSYFNPDYVLAIFVIFLMYSEYKKQYILFGFWACMICMTKETGLIVVAGYVGWRALIYFVKAEGKLRSRVKSCFNDRINIASLAPIFMYIVYSLIRGGLFTWSQNADATSSNFRWSNTDINCFGFQPTYILLKFKQLFLMNFSWLFYSVIIVSSIIVIYKYKKVQGMKMELKAEAFYGFTGVAMAYLLFSNVFVTAALYRYNVIWVLFTGIFCCAIFREAVKGYKEVIYISGLLLLGVCGILQSFLCIDPVSIAILPTLNAGNNKLLFASNLKYYGDTLVYNYQYTGLNDVYEHMLTDMQYDKDKRIILNDYEWAAGSQIGGNYGFYKIYWDKEKKQSSMQRTESTVEISTQSIDDFVVEREFPKISGPSNTDLKNAPSEIIYSYLPMLEEDSADTLSKLEEYYDIGKVHSYTTFYNRINYYRLIKKNNIQILKSMDNISSFDNIPEADSSEIQLPKKDIFLSKYINLEVADKELAVATFNYGKMKFTEKIKDGRDTIQNGDIIQIESEIYKNNEFWKADVIEIFVGTDEVIREVSEAFLGKKVGDNVSVKYYLSDEDAEIELRAKIIKLEGKLSASISEHEANQLGFKTAEELKHKLTKYIIEDRILQFWENDFVDIISESKFIQYNNIERQAYKEQYYNYYKKYAENNSISFEKYVTDYLQISEIEFEQKADKYAVDKWKKTMILKALAERYEDAGYKAELEIVNTIMRYSAIE